MAGLFPGSDSADGGELATLEGAVDHIVFQSEETGFTVLRVEDPEREKPVVAVGMLPGVRPGERLRMQGRWVDDRKFGRQFRAETFVTLKPSTLVGIRKYLESGMIKGVGKVMAERIVDEFGLETLDVLDESPEKLVAVEGIGKSRIESIRASWAAHNEIQAVMIFLQSHGVSAGFAQKIFRCYGTKSISKVSENPYRLAIDIPGIGFRSADQIAVNLGIERDSPKRIEAGVVHVLSELSSRGHVYLPHDGLVAKTLEILDVGDRVLVVAALGVLAERGDVVVERVGDDDAVYLNALYLCERGAAERLAKLGKEVGREVKIDVPRAIRWFEEQYDIRLGDEQRDALRTTIEGRVVVLTGGPGTGKTTLVNAILQVLGRKLKKIELAAPTGRAAKRLAEATGREARTIHRLLEYNPQTVTFARDEDNPIDADLVIIDETSMLDIVMFHQLLLAIPFGARLVLVGDVDQLPSVGPGRVLHDVIESGVVAVARLEQIFRQAAESLIITNAHRIHHGEMPHFRSTHDHGDFFFHECEDPEAALAVIKRLVAERIPARFGLRPIEDVQVLTPMHKGELGSIRLNEELQELLNPAADALERGGRKYRVGDKVMQIQNNYDLEVFNGDIGRIALIDIKERKVSVSYEGRLVEYETSDLDELVLAYACSIHKAQGSEFPAVVIPLHTQHWVMLKRNLVYTAVTRGKKLVVVVGSRRALATAVRNEREQPRFSALAARVRGGGDLA